MCCRPEPERVLGGGFVGEDRPIDSTCKCDGCPGPEAEERAAVWSAIAAELEHGLLVVKTWVRSLAESDSTVVVQAALAEPPEDVQHAFDLLDMDAVAVERAGHVRVGQPVAPDGG